MERDGASTTEALATIDAAWEEWAKGARRARTTLGAVEVGLGGLALATGTVLHLAFPRGTEHDSWKPLLFGFGGLQVIFGVYNLVVESRIETSFRTWRAVHATGESAQSRPRPSFGFAPLPGGGAISMGFAF
jgi:hypothetical protein